MVLAFGLLGVSAKAQRPPDVTVESFLHDLRTNLKVRAPYVEPSQVRASVPRDCPIADEALRKTFQGESPSKLDIDGITLLFSGSTGDLDTAERCAQRATQLLPDSPDALHTLGWIYLKKNLSDDAIVTFRKLLDSGTVSSALHFHLGMALAQKGYIAPAIWELEDALEAHPSELETVRVRRLLEALQERGGAPQRRR
jgi:tetratricopeptide (TPR) repeat protein